MVSCKEFVGVPKKLLTTPGQQTSVADARRYTKGLLMGVREKRPPPPELISGSDIADLLGIAQPTWGRTQGGWQPRGIPRPFYENNNIRLYRVSDIVVFFDELNELAAATKAEEAA